MATTNDLKNGLVLNIDGQLWTVVEFQHVKPGKGPAFVRTKLKNVMSGKVVDKTFNAGVKVETANVDRRDMQYLYKDGSDYVFMDGDTYDQIHVPGETVGSGQDYLLENTEAVVAVHDGHPVQRPAHRVGGEQVVDPGRVLGVALDQLHRVLADLRRTLVRGPGAAHPVREHGLRGDAPVVRLEEDLEGARAGLVACGGHG